jgi:peptidoglycan/LPS O-acetylase OafA/YrhL
LDALGVGSLLAILSVNHSDKSLPDRVLTWRYLIFLLFLAVLLQVFLVHGYGWPVYLVFFELIVALIFVWAVWQASKGFAGLGGWALENKLIMYLGKISYGIYVYHLFSPHLVRWISDLLGIDLHYRGPLEFAFSTMTTILMASLSWFLMEAPINNLKHRFLYVPDAEKDAGSLKEKTSEHYQETKD